jgi:hypothetical protein
MALRASPHFTEISLEDAFNCTRSELPPFLRTPEPFVACDGPRVIRGMPFRFGSASGENVVLLDRKPISIALDGALATYVLFVHAVEDAGETGPPRKGAVEAAGYGLGAVVSEYELVFEDGSQHASPIARRFAIQQARYGWGSAPFACVPAAEDVVRPAPEESLLLDAPSDRVDLLPTRVRHAVYSADDMTASGMLWIYALFNPFPDMPLRAVVCRPRSERSAVYAVTTTTVAHHPLRPGVRRKLRLRLPESIDLNAVSEVDHDKIAIDLGVVISARAVLDYDEARWLSEEAVVEPRRSEREVIVEYAAHPAARLYIGEEIVELASPTPDAVEVPAAERPVRLRFVEQGFGAPVAVRLHLHGAAGEYLPPRGHHRRVNRVWHQDNYAEFANVENQYAYVDGECLVDLPHGDVFVEVTRGHEILPIRTKVEVTAETHELVFELEKVLRWRERGWVTADTHVHFLSPQTALLEGSAEGVNVVNLLASQWGEMFSNVGDFDGQTTFGADRVDGSGEFLVRVGSENRMQVLGHISLLGYKGQLIHPLCTGGPDESAFGDPLEVTMAEWAQRCLDQGGLVVMPHAPTPQLERAADIVLGLVNAIELMSFNPLNPQMWALDAYGLADWYRYLNLGYHVPLVGGSDKMTAASLLGGVRSYAQLGDRELSYENWMDAIRDGNTFVTVGPLAALRVDGIEPGGTVRLPAGGGTLQVEWEVESVRLPIERTEVVVGGLVCDDMHVAGRLSARGVAQVRVATSTWIALRIRGSYRNEGDDIACHTSAVQVLVEGSDLFSEVDSMAVLDQIQGAIAYVDTLAPRADARRFQELRATLEGAYNRLHQRMHAAGLYHRHPLHDPATPHEH